MLYMLYGVDDFSATQALEDIKDGLGDRELLATNTTVLDGKQLLLNQLRTVCETMPFLADKRLVIVHGLLGRFERGGKSGRRKSIKEGNHKDNYEEFADYVTTIPGSTVMVLIDHDIKEQNPLLKKLATQAKVRSFPILRGVRLHQWIEKRVERENASISSNAVVLLADSVGGNLWILASEVTKLALFAKGRCIEEKDVESLVSYSQQGNVFAMVDAILEGKSDSAERIMQQLLQTGAAPSYLLVMLARQLNLMIRLKEMRRLRITSADIQNKLNLNSDYVYNKTMELANRYNVENITSFYHHVLEYDLAIKRGKYEGVLALNILVAELCSHENVILT